MKNVVFYLLSVLFFATAVMTTISSVEAQEVKLEVNLNDNSLRGSDPAECDPSAGMCCPTTTKQKIMIGGGSLAAFLLSFFIFVRMLEQSFIKQKKDPITGRHLGISLSLFVSSLLMAALIFVITKCWPAEFNLWIGVLGIIWLFHLLFVLFSLRSKDD